MRTQAEVATFMAQLHAVFNVRVKRHLDRTECRATIFGVGVLEWILGQRESTDALLALATVEIRDAAASANRNR